ncbi:MAG: SpoIIE family protein phosphatase [Treponemataceae bacterium]|nr:SpoIIE family protein phosphatase [Treponemataceae bacterium]
MMRLLKGLKLKPHSLKKVLFFCALILSLSFSSARVFAQDYYWEDPVKISSNSSMFPSFASNNNSENMVSVLIWQNIVQSRSKKEIYLSAKIYYEKNGVQDWVTKENFAGPFTFSGEVPNISSVSVNKDGTIAVAVLSSTKSVSVFTTSLGDGTAGVDADGENNSGTAGGEDTAGGDGATNGDGTAESAARSQATFEFSRYDLKSSTDTAVAPRIYTNSNGGFMIFATKSSTRGDISTFSFLQSQSSDGRKWTEFSAFRPTEKTSNPFVPYLYSYNGIDYLVFQASHTTVDEVNVNKSRRTYQIYSCLSSDGGRTWTDPVLVTDDTVKSLNAASDAKFDSYQNQNPTLISYQDKMYIAWEKTHYTSENAQIYFAEFGLDGRIIGNAELISSGNAGASTPYFFIYKDNLSLIWTDARSGNNSIIMAQKKGYFWEETTLSKTNNENTFGLAIVSNFQKDLNIFWQEKSGRQTRIMQLSPDRSVAKPSIKALSFKPGKKSTSQKVRSSVILPKDSSGIEGFAYIWTQDENEDVPETFMNLPSQNQLTEFATEDGKWFLKVKVLDYAGNWSKAAVITYIRDTTPPLPPVIKEIPLDDKGFAKSNTFSIEWDDQDEEDEIAGYSYNFALVASKDSKAPRVPSRIVTSNKKISFKNADNGIYAFSVSAIDECGNISQSSTVYISLNKYIPYTTVTSAKYEADEFGTINLSIIGKGFTAEGKITEIYIDADGKAPYDKTLLLSQKDFTIGGDKLIKGIELEDMEEGTYKIGLLHAKRGLYFTNDILKVTESGTVKTGDYSYEFKPSWQKIEQKKFKLNMSLVIVILITLMMAIGFVTTLFATVKTVKDSRLLKLEINALITGDAMPLEKKKKAKDLQKIAFSLKYKLAIVTSVLISFIIMLVSVPLGYIMINDQETTLATSLENQVSVLLDSIISGTKTYLPSQNILELGFLPQQSSALEEANYVTIIGLSEQMNSTDLNFVWATNDNKINSKIDTKEERVYGRSRLVIDEMEEISKNCKELNDEAIKQASSIAQEISVLTKEGISLALRTDSKSVARRDEISDVTRALNSKLNSTLSEIANEGFVSIPKFDNQQLDRKNTTYLFYKPVLYRQGSEENFVRGVVLMEISTDGLIKNVDKARTRIILLTALIALFAIAIGVIVSLIFANIIVIPLKKLTTHVKMIRDTGNKTELKGRDINIKSRDEIRLLGDNINDMAHQLVEAAVYENMLLGGKEVQRAFLPLDMIDPTSKTKLSVGHMETKNIQFFGYYEGAKGVSGDYFDFKDLDGRYAALIKCDVSGKGSPAALIMAEVAALFCDYFKTWTIKKNGTNLAPLVSKINDHLEARNLKGKFAAFTLALFDTQEGDIYFCNAGDNIIHIYDSTEHVKKTIALTETPPAGPFPSFMVEMKGGYPVEKLHLNSGDVLFLYTDGIEEAKRLYRDVETGKALRFKPDTAVEVLDEDDKDATDGEEMSPERVNSIIEAVMARKKYKLVKKANPVDDITSLDFEFDFTNCKGTPEEVIMALVSIEKVFRLYKDSSTNSYDHAVIDKKVDAFMKDHFVQYETYCAEHADHPMKELEAEYMYYTNVKEDEQFDDLTLVAIKKK